MCENQKQINVTINKEGALLPEGITVLELLESKGVKARSSVWINGKQLLLAEYPDWVIREGDELKILRVVAGG